MVTGVLRIASGFVAGASLFYSGLLHAWQPFYFAHHIAAYGIFPVPIITVVAIVVPYLQLLVGVCLVMEIGGRTAHWLSLLLFGSFAMMQAKIILRGEEISCGCFGFASEAVSWRTIAVPIVLLLFTAAAMIHRAKLRVDVGEHDGAT